jgi:hypothetical protein
MVHIEGAGHRFAPRLFIVAGVACVLIGLVIVFFSLYV